jgi:hypothetical protein
MIQLTDHGGNVVAAANNDVRITRPAKQMALVYHCLVLFVHPSYVTCFALSWLVPILRQRCLPVVMVYPVSNELYRLVTYFMIWVYFVLHIKILRVHVVPSPCFSYNRLPAAVSKRFCNLWFWAQGIRIFSAVTTHFYWSRFGGKDFCSNLQLHVIGLP